MKSVGEMTRKEFLSLPVYKDWQSYLFVNALYMIQTKKKAQFRLCLFCKCRRN